MRSAIVVMLVSLLFPVLARSLQAQQTVPPPQNRATSGPLYTDARTPITSLPYTISQCGSYFVTDCLIGVASQHGITISASNVTLDLNGFTLGGVEGSFDGIHVVGDQENVVIHDGSVNNWGGNGIDASTVYDGRIERVYASSNDGSGIDLGSNVDAGVIRRAILRLCTASDNGLDGIRSRAALVDTCQTWQNGGVGFDLHSTSTAVDCSSRLNQLGFNGYNSTTFDRCLAYSNATHGILVTSQCMVLRCESLANGNDAIRVEGSSNRVEACSMVGACDGTMLGLNVVGTGNLLIKNSASGYCGGSHYVFAVPNSGAFGAWTATMNAWDNIIF